MVCVEYLLNRRLDIVSTLQDQVLDVHVLSVDAAFCSDLGLQSSCVFGSELFSALRCLQPCS